MQEKLKELIKKYVEEELTTTDDAEGYSIPHAFKKKKKKKVDEALEKEDMQNIKKLIRDVVGDILRDIWLKRASWK
jgi:hypothetical protein